MNIFVTVPVIGSTCLLCVIYIFVTGVMNIFVTDEHFCYG